MAVNLAELIHKGGIFDEVEGSSAEEIYSKVINVMALPKDVSADSVLEAVIAREKLMSTAVGNGIALPHSRIPVIKDEKDQCVCVIYLKNPIDMHAPDERLVRTMFMILTKDQQTHLGVLSSLVGLLQKPDFKKLIEKRAGEAELLNVIRDLS